MKAALAVSRSSTVVDSRPIPAPLERVSPERLHDRLGHKIGASDNSPLSCNWRPPEPRERCHSGRPSSTWSSAWPRQEVGTLGRLPSSATCARLRSDSATRNAPDKRRRLSGIANRTDLCRQGRQELEILDPDLDNFKMPLGGVLEEPRIAPDKSSAAERVGMGSVANLPRSKQLSLRLGVSGAVGAWHVWDNSE